MSVHAPTLAEAPTSPATRFLRPLLPVVLALLAGAVVLLATGENPLTVYYLLLREAFGGPARIAATLTSATPILFTGLATAVAFRAGVFSLGVEGGFVLGGLAGALLAAHLTDLPGPVVMLAALLAGAAAGLLTNLAPGVLRAWWAVDEVVTTLMLNFVVAGVASWLVTSYFQAEGVANSATKLIPVAARLPRLMPPYQLSLGIVIALALVAGYAVWIRYSSLGYELRQVGANPRFAVAQGIRQRRVVLLAMLISGAIAGLGGSVHALGVVHRFVEGFSPGYGFTGVAVALLGRNSALGITVGALLFGALASAGATVQLFSNVPLDIVDVLSGTVMVFAVVKLAFSWRFGRRTA